MSSADRVALAENHDLVRNRTVWEKNQPFLRFPSFLYFLFEPPSFGISLIHSLGQKWGCQKHSWSLWNDMRELLKKESAGTKTIYLLKSTNLSYVPTYPPTSYLPSYLPYSTTWRNGQDHCVHLKDLLFAQLAVRAVLLETPSIISLNTGRFF